eukprot:gene1149-3713_t
MNVAVPPVGSFAVQLAVPQKPKQAVEKVKNAAPAAAAVEVDWIVTKLRGTEEVKNAIAVCRKSLVGWKHGAMIEASDWRRRESRIGCTITRFGVYSDGPRALIGCVEMLVIDFALMSTIETEIPMNTHVFREIKQRIDGEAGGSSVNINSFAKLLEIAVNPEFQRQGIGRKLVNAVVQAIKEIGARVSKDIWGSLGFGTISRAPDREPMNFEKGRLSANRQPDANPFNPPTNPHCDRPPALANCRPIRPSIELTRFDKI